MWAGARSPAVALAQARGPRTPPAWSRCPRSRARGPLPPAPSEICIIISFSSEGYVSLSLQTRRGFARSSQSALGEFRSLVPRTLFALSYTSSLRSSLSPRLARYARHRYAVFFCRTGLKPSRLNNPILPKISTIYLTSRKWPFILIPCINHIYPFDYSILPK